jgi:PAS domain S-box-containing protein
MHRCLFEEAADGIIIADAVTARMWEVNPRAEELTGYKRAELLQMTLGDLIAPESLAEQRLRWGVLREDVVIFAERLIRRKDGSVFVGELSGRRSEGRVIGLLRDISQRKKLEADLGVSEARYRSAVRVAPDAIAEVDTGGRLQMVSPATLQLFGCEHEQQLLGETLLALVAPAERGRALALCERYMSGARASHSAEPLWLKRLNGELVLCEVSAAPVQNEAGALVSHALFARDITERSRAEAKIRQLSRLYALLSHVNQAVIRSRERQDLFQTVCDVAVEHGGFRMAWIGMVDEGTQRLVPVAHAGHEDDYLTGLLVNLNDPRTGRGPAATALRQGGLAVCDDIAADDAMAAWREAALERGYRTVASVALRVKGRSVATLNVYGDRVGFFSADEQRLMQELGDDISAALAFMEAQADRLHAESALRASEERFRSLVQNSMDGIAMYGAEGAIHYLSPAVSRILGYAPAELLGGNVYDLLHVDDREQMRADFALLLQAQGASMQRDRRYRHKDGSYRFIESVASNLLHVPSVGAIVDNFRDITERRRAAEERQRLLAELNHTQKLDSIGRLAGGVAHDFNNMLAVILGSVELALNDLRTPWQVQGFLREIRDAATRSADLTKQLLTFARKLPAAPKVIDVNAVVEGALKLLRRLIGENVSLVWKPGSNIWQIEMDPTRLGQVLTNLTVNARDAIGGVGVATIETSNCAVDAAYCIRHANVVLGDYVKLSVSDTGAGMPAEVQTHMFEPFFTTKRPGRGTGLGLATVYGIVKQYGGFIQVQSAPGQGSRFDIYLPRHNAKPELPRTAQRALGAPAPGSAMILVVEDEPQVLLLVTTLLQNLGYGVVSAPTPQAALELVRARSDAGEPAPDLVLTDVVMPGMNGVELTRALRALHPGLRSIFMSGYLADAKANLAGDSSIILYKPFTLKTLAESVHAVLSGPLHAADG